MKLHGQSATVQEIKGRQNNVRISYCGHNIDELIVMLEEVSF